MSRIVKQWIDRHEKQHGMYSAYAGFVDEISQNDLLGELWTSLEADESSALFAWVVGLLHREATSAPEVIDDEEER